MFIVNNITLFIHTSFIIATMKLLIDSNQKYNFLINENSPYTQWKLLYNIEELFDNYKKHIK